MLKHIPNMLTMIRFLLIPFIIILVLQGNFVSVIVLLTISGITDILDGTIARRFNLVTDVGKLLDPLADKATQCAILITLTTQGFLHFIPLWILIIVILKELLMITGSMFLYGKELVVSSKWYRKTCYCLILYSNCMFIIYSLLEYYISL